MSINIIYGYDISNIKESFGEDVFSAQDVLKYYIDKLNIGISSLSDNYDMNFIIGKKIKEYSPLHINELIISESVDEDEISDMVESLKYNLNEENTEVTLNILKWLNDNIDNLEQKTYIIYVEKD